MSETLLKLDPRRGLFLRGVDGYGAFCSITNATASGFTVTGVYRDAADFAVIAFDSENGGFEHALMRPLPDFDHSGLTLSFDLSTTGVWGIDSRYFPTVNQMRLGVITHPASGPEQNILCSLWQNAKLKSGTFTAASCSFTVGGPPAINDQIILFVGNTAFNYTGTGTDTAATVASSLTYQINNYDWSSFAQSSVTVMATWDGIDTVTLTFARTGKVSVSGNTVTWQANGSLPSEVFVGLSAGQPFIINGTAYTIASATSAMSLTLTSSPSLTAGTHYTYLSPMGGEDGNGVTCYIAPLPSNTGITLSTTTLPFSGGVSDGLVWTVTLNVSTLTGVLPADVANPLNPSTTQISASFLRQCWITIGPKINPNAAYADTEWSMTVSNWSVTGTGRNLSIAGAGSVRVGSRDSWTMYTGRWSEDAAYVHYQGFAHLSSTPGDSISVKYSCGATHDLYIGTEFYVDRQIVNVSLDGDTPTALDTYQSGDAPAYGRRKLRLSAAAGDHVVTITLSGTHNSAAVPAGGLYSFLFDFIEAAVLGDVQDPAVTYSNVNSAVDFDTLYQLPPERIVWQLQTLGMLGKANLDLGVFWLYNRVRVGAVFSTAVITFTGSWANADSAVVNIGGFAIGKSVVGGDTNTTIAKHFAYYINEASAGFRASASGGVLTITQRSTGVEFTATVTATATSSSTGAVSPSTQSVGVGTEGTWTIDDAASPLLNVAVRAWLPDWYAALATASIQGVTAVTMEVVNPPSGYVAQFADGSAVGTATGFGSLVSNQCAVGASKVLTLQKETFKEVAAMMIAAGLTAYLQCGEMGWWYFPKRQSIPLGNVANTYPAVIGLAVAHDMTSSDHCVIVGVYDASGNVSAVNGTWPVTVVDATHFSIAAAGGSWDTGTGVVSYGGMGVYDPETMAAASTALGRPLASFYTQDDDPTVNTADISFLQNRLFAHFTTLQRYIQGLYPSAVFELLYPCDVNCAPLYWNKSWAYAQGGRFNHAVNWPSQLASRSTSGFDSLLIEGLSWGASYRSLDEMKAAMAWPFANGNSWPTANVSYLVAVFNGGCPWVAEYLAALNAGYPNLRLWALDQVDSQALPVSRMPVNRATAS